MLVSISIVGEDDNLNGPSTEAVALEEIKRWLREEKQNLHARLEDKYLLTFLRGCHFDLEKTKTKMINYYTMKKDEVVWYRKRDPSLDEIQELVKLGVYVPLRELYQNHLVVIIRTGAHDPKKHTQDNVFRTGQMLTDIITFLEYDCSTIDGIIAIFDMKGVTVWHAKPLTPSVVKRSVFGWTNYLLPPDQFEFVNAPFYLNVMINLFKSCMSEEMKRKVRVHKGLESFHKVFDKTILPVEYGGNGESLSSLILYWNEKLLSYRDWLLEDEKYRAE
ncbi:retinol-binding protein pinta isoform X1 [Leptinotarsa decemlineata]|uniref:retinol-binding protein pinta isoform X1 n=1 Tax=Leptinotarsa decemlineata TaxID=7539 RepID=UPI003D306ABE